MLRRSSSFKSSVIDNTVSSSEANQSSYDTAEGILSIDAYDAVPTIFHTYNPPYYHNYIKNGGFRTECGVVQYQIRFEWRPINPGATAPRF